MDPSDFRKITEVVNHKWDLAVLTHLHGGPLRFTDLKIRIKNTNSGLSERMLSKILKRLRADGLIQQRAIDRRHHVWALAPRGQQVVAEIARVGEFLSGGDGRERPKTDSAREDPTEGIHPPGGTRRDAGDGDGDGDGEQ